MSVAAPSAAPTPGTPAPTAASRVRRMKIPPPAIAIVGAACAVISVFLLAPMVVVVVSSLTTTKYLNFPPKGVTLHWYSTILSHHEFLSGFETSLELAVAAAAIAVLVSVPAAWALHHADSRLARALEGAYLSPMILPAVVIGLGYLVMLQKLNVLGTFAGAMLAHVVLVTPFILRSVTSGLRGLDPNLEEAAQSLGAGRLRAFVSVVLPDLRKAIVAGCVMAFVISFDETVVTLFIVGPHFTTLPVRIFTYLQYSDDPTIAAVSTVLILISIAIMSVLSRFATFADAG